MRTSAVVVMALLGACTIDERTVQLPEEPTQHSATYFDIPVGIALETDILVVVDNSPAMAPHAERVIPQLAKTLAHYAGSSDPDWHVGVITSDLGGPGCSERGDDGLFRSEGLVGARFLIEWRHLDQRHTANYQGDFEDAFAQLAAVGTAGCARQQPLAAIRRALEQPRNAGFRREGASLVIFVISASDDGSIDAIADHAAFLAASAPQVQLALVGVYDRPAPRLDEAFAAFPNRAFRSDLSAEDPLSNLWLPIRGGRGWWGVPCLEGDLGPVPECSVSDVIFDDDGARVYESVLPRCDAGDTNKPCWHIETDLQNCPMWSGSQSQVLKFERRDYPRPGTHVIGTCVTR